MLSRKKSPVGRLVHAETTPSQSSIQINSIKIEELTTQIDFLTEALIERAQECQQWQQKYHQIKKAFDEFYSPEKIIQIEQQVKFIQIHQQNNEGRKEQEFRKMQEDYINQLSILENTVKQRDQQIQDLYDQKEMKHRNNSISQQQNEKIIRDMNKLDSQVRELEQQLYQKDRTISELQYQLKQSEDHFHQFKLQQRQSGYHIEELNEKKQIISHLQNKLVEIQNKDSEYQSIIQSQQNKIARFNALEDSLDSALKKNIELAQRNEDLLKQLEQQKSNNYSHQASHFSYQTENNLSLNYKSKYNHQYMKTESNALRDISSNFNNRSLKDFNNYISSPKQNSKTSDLYTNSIKIPEKEKYLYSETKSSYTVHPYIM